MTEETKSRVPLWSDLEDLFMALTDIQKNVTYLMEKVEAMEEPARG